VNIAEFLRSLNVFDLVVVLVMMAFFIVGYIQGTIRRLLGIASILFSFLLAANLRDPLGGFFAANWTQFGPEYSHLIAFGVVFVAAVVGFSLTIQTFYTKLELSEKYPVVDEMLGGVLGILQGMIILGAMIAILDSFFLVPGIAPDSDELPFLRTLHEAFNPSGTALLYRETLMPAFLAVVGPLLPEAIRDLYR
jgi:membrane protein required for colicin V production